MAILRKAVHVRDPKRHRTVLLLPGEEPEPRLAALVTNPDAWEDGELPVPADAKDDGDGDDQKNDTKPAAPTAAKKTAAKKTAASSRSRGRDAAGEGTSGD